MRVSVIWLLFAVLFASAFFISTGCKKHSGTSIDSSKIHVGPPYYPKMGNVHNWKGFYHDIYADPNHVNDYDVSGNYPDTSCAVTFIDTNTITLFDETYTYSSCDSVKHIYYFGNGYYFSMGYALSEGVIYYSDNDSIVLGYLDYHNTWGYWYHERIRHTY